MPDQPFNAATARSVVRGMLSQGAAIEIEEPHAARRMAERGMTLADINFVLRRGFVDEQRIDCIRGAWRYLFRVPDRGVAVEIEVENNLIIVVTVIRYDS